MEYITYNSGSELYHHGIRGMKWGIRRYQNKDGSLTAAGKKKRASEEAKLKERERMIKGKERAAASRAKLDAKKAELDAREKALRNPKNALNNKTTANAPKRKTVKDLTDDELRAEINRMKLEKDYYDARKNLADANPRQVSTGKKFVNGLLDDVVVPAAKSVGKEYLEKFMKDKLGLNDKKAKSLLPEVKTWDDMKKKQEWEKNERDEARERKQYEKETKEIKFQRDELDKQRKQLEKERKEFEKKRKQEQGGS